MCAKQRQQLVLNPAVEHRIRRLVDEQRGAELLEDRKSHRGLLGRVGRDPHVESFSLAYGGIEGSHCLPQIRVGVEAMRIEHVDVVDTHSLEALVEAGKEILPRSPVAVGPGPHVPASFRGDQELVPIGRQVLFENPPKIRLSGSKRYAVVVGEVEVRDAEIERAAIDRPLHVERLGVAEVTPEAERDGWKQQAARAAAAIGHAVIAVFGR